VIAGIVGSVIHPGTAWPWHCDHIGPHEQRVAIAKPAGMNAAYCFIYKINAEWSAVLDRPLEAHLSILRSGGEHVPLRRARCAGALSQLSSAGTDEGSSRKAAGSRCQKETTMTGGESSFET